GGVPSRDILKMLSQEQGVPLDHLAVAHEKENAYLPLIAQVEPINAVVGIARGNYGKIPLAVASGGTHRAIQPVLEHFGILRPFQPCSPRRNIKNRSPLRGFFLGSCPPHRIPPPILPSL